MNKDSKGSMLYTQIAKSVFCDAQINFEMGTRLSKKDTLKSLSINLCKQVNFGNKIDC